MSKRATPQPPRLPGVWTVLRDILTFFGGWTLIFLEVQRPDVRESVLVFGGTAIGVPGLAVGLTSIIDAYRRQSGTDSSPSEPAEPASPRL